RPAANADLNFFLTVLIAALLSAAGIALALVLLATLSGFVALLLLTGLRRILALLALVILIHIRHE
ncbi:MAG TPA: hypothetical protein VN815_17135, partial [Steroidobacteraceae bacterium]|nr:hypothetical protein [Steroidobacteraceae bacterium]